MSRRKRVRIKARELTDVDVDYISIVSRGANRIPFRILKAEDNEMLDLSQIFFRKEEPKTPALVAVAVAKGPTSDAIMAVVRDSYTVTSESDMGEVTLMKFEEDADLAKADIVKVSDDLAVFVSNVQKGAVSYPDSVSFMENISKAGFLPSLRMATEVLMETVYNVVSTPGDRSTTVAKLESSLGEYQSYVLGLTRAMPEQVFKFESAEFSAQVAEVQKGMLDADDQKDAPVEEPKAEVAPTPEPKVEEKAKAKKEDESGSDTDVTDDTSETVAEAVVKSQDDANEKLAAELKTMLSEFGEKFAAMKTEISTEVSGLNSKIDGLAAKVEEVEQVAKSADEAVRGTVHTEVGNEETATGTRTKKSENGIFDDVLKFPGFEVV
jgi:outer membrane murein-binding lipoprotein Lpp